MKAVILAGGEGTRLRPLTSNQPKPMMPLVNRPMLEHIIALLAKHGFDDIVVTVAYLANQIRDYFGDGSDFGVRMRYATEEQPLGTAGSVRNASDELDETFLVISGDVLTDIDLSAFVAAHRAKDAVASIALEAGREPVRVRHRHHPARRVDRAIPREAHLGRGVLRHHQHRDLRARAVDLRPHPRRGGRRLLGRRVPGGARRGRASPRPRRRRLLGGRRHHRGLPAGPRRRARRPRRGRDRRLRPRPRASGWGRGPRSIPAPRLEAPLVIGANCRIEAGAHAAGLHGARHRRRRAQRSVPRAHGVPRPRLRRSRRPPARQRHRPRHRPAPARPPRRGSGGRRRVLRRRERGRRTRASGSTRSRRSKPTRW